MQLAGSRSAMSEINVAPMIDVMLVLLIIFMVATPVVTMGYLVKVPPTAKAAPPAVEVPLVVRLADDGHIFLNREVVGPDALTMKLQDYASAHPGRMVFFAGSRKSSYEETMSLLDRMHAAGVTNIGIVVEKMEGSR